MEDTYDPILYMRTLGLLDDEMLNENDQDNVDQEIESKSQIINKYEGFISKMQSKLNTINSRIAEHVEK